MTIVKYVKIYIFFLYREQDEEDAQSCMLSNVFGLERGKDHVIIVIIMIIMIIL